jgi:hypothetical protein
MLLASLLLIAMPQADDAAPLQILAGPSFEALLRETEAACPGSKIRYVTPATLLDAEDQFDAQLSPAERLRVTRALPRTADGMPVRCAASEGGASCPANAELDGFRKAGVLKDFARAVCGHGTASWN